MAMSKYRKYYYYLPEQETAEDAVFVQSIWAPSESDDIVIDCAEDWHARGGWEADWPVDFVVLHEGLELGRYRVGREMLPNFYVEKKLVVGE